MAARPEGPGVAMAVVDDTWTYEQLLELQERIGFVEVGVPDSVVKRLPVVTVRAPVTHNCSICLDGYEVSATMRCLPCSHTFHQACIDPWLKGHKHCPLCKEDVAATGASVGEVFDRLMPTSR